MFDNKVVLITGGTGTFGSATAQHLLKISPKISEIRIFSRDEKKQDEMRDKICDSRVKFFIGDVRNYDSLLTPMKDANFVFHAAALKQVPSCEFFPLEAVHTNILGSENVFKAALRYDVGCVVALSTDKAVYPINSMGISKAMLEKLVAAKARLSPHTRFCITRYGNVMASRGSVIPKFIEQILANKPITLTDPSMTRFLLSIDEAVGLVLYALRHGKQGDLFVRKSPAATLGVIVAALKKIFNSDTEVKTIGMRHGEKVFETLVTFEEMAKARDCGEYYCVPVDTRTMDYYSRSQTGISGNQIVSDYTSNNTRRLFIRETVTLLKSLSCVQEALKQ